MAQQMVNIGTVANDGTGDTLRDAGDKINDNFTELYAGLTGLLDFKGSTDASGNPNYPAASKGDFYLVSVAGKIGGASGTDVEVGDSYFATADNAGGTQAAVGASWTVVQGNITGSIGVSGLDDVGDVNAPSPSNGDVLTWDDTPGEWVPAAPTGGSNALDDLTDVDTTGVADGDVLTFDSGSGDWVPAAPTGGSGGPVEFIGTTNTLTSGALEITGMSLANYSKIDLVFENLTCATANWQARVISGNSSDGWVESTFYDYASNTRAASGTGDQNGVENTTGFAMLDNTTNFNAAASSGANAVCGEMTIFAPGDTTYNKQGFFHALNGQGGSGVNTHTTGGGRMEKTAAMDRIRVTALVAGVTTALSGGRVTAYGWKRS
jgi:hypothetical protein